MLGFTAWNETKMVRDCPVAGMVGYTQLGWTLVGQFLSRFSLVTFQHFDFGFFGFQMFFFLPRLLFLKSGQAGLVFKKNNLF